MNTQTYCRHCEKAIHRDRETGRWEDLDGHLSCRPWDAVTLPHEPPQT